MSEPLLGTGGQEVLPAADTVVFDASVNGGAVKGYLLKPGADIYVRVHGMHIDRTDAGGTDGRARVAGGEARLFVADDNNIEKISCEPVIGTCTLTGYVQKR